MGPGGVFPAEMPERGRSLVDPLDDDTAERLLAGRVSPDDAPPGYAGVAGILQAASGPAAPEELAGREAALAIFRAHRPGPGRRPRTSGPGPQVRRRPRGRSRRRLAGRSRSRVAGRSRARVVALALAGVVAAGGLWTAAVAPSPAGLPSRAGAPKSGGAGSGAPGLVTQARPRTPPVTGGVNGPATTGPSGRERSVARRGGAGGGSASGAATGHRPGKPPKPKPKPKAEKPNPGKPNPEKPNPGKPNGKPEPGHQR
jgi:hypothetical protein